MNAIAVVAGASLVFLALAGMTFIATIGRVWMRAAASGAPVPLFRLVGMKLRGNPPGLLVDAYILLVKQNAGVSLDEAENAYMQNRNRIRYAEELAQLAKEARGRK